MNSFRDLFSLSKKKVLLSGASGYLGYHFAKGLASHGAELALVDINIDKLETLSKELFDNFKIKSNVYQCDIGNETQVEKVSGRIIKDFSYINVLVNNAQGFDVCKSIENVSLTEWRRTSSVNEEGLFLLSKAIGKHMQNLEHGGSIINISSIYGIMGPDHRIYQNDKSNFITMPPPAVYSFTKSGIIGFSKYLSTYWANKNIRVNSLTPGGVKNSQDNSFVKKYNNRVPLGRMAEPEEMIGGLIYLASDASSYVTGQNLIIDGGLSAW